MGWFVPFLLPWDKQQLESSSTAQYLEQTILADCIYCSEIRLNESTKEWRLYVFGPLCSLNLARKKNMEADGVAILSELFHHGVLIISQFFFSKPEDLAHTLATEQAVKGHSLQPWVALKNQIPFKVISFTFSFKYNN